MLFKLEKLPFIVIVFIGGILLIMSSFYIPSDLKKLNFVPRSDILWPLLSIGIFLIIVSCIMYFLSTGFLRFSKDKFVPVSASINNTVINILLGKIEDCDCSEEDSAIIISTNEYFDEHVFRDKRSALGSYLNKYFRDDLEDFIEIVEKNIQNYPFQIVEKDDGKKEKSYGIGQ